MESKTNNMKEDFLIENFGDRRICLKGVGKLFYQEGFPISMSIERLKKDDIEVSILHVADECLKSGWSAKTTISKLQEDFTDSQGEVISSDLLIEFCNADYETQREMIFQHLFNTSTDEVRKGNNTEPLEWLTQKPKQ